eukprot:jgi/Psemu1/10373/gm1.10373_g
MPAVNNGGLRRQAPNQPSWFLGAPITKILCILWAAGSLWIIRSDNLEEENYYDRRNYDDYHSNSWGSAVFPGPSSWVFQSTTEVVVGLSFLARYLRRLEQELSSRRLVAWLIFLQVVFVFVRLVAVATLDENAFAGSASAKGPYLVIGGLLYWYRSCVPRLYPRFLSSTLLGVSCSEKAFPYLWALYVLCMRGTASLLVGAVGVFASAIYFFLLSESTKTARSSSSSSSIPFLDIPDAVVNRLPWESLCGVFFLDPSPGIYAPFITMRAAMNLRNGGGGGGGDAQPRRHRGERAQQRAPPVPEAPAEAMPLPVASPEAVAQLTSMGFEEERVKEALLASDNNIERAANILLMGS